MYLEADVCF